MEAPTFPCPIMLKANNDADTKASITLLADGTAMGNATALEAVLNDMRGGDDHAILVWLLLRALKEQEAKGETAGGL